MYEANFKFTPPPEAQTFRPTLKEFEDPLIYLEKIRPMGSKTGICKIIPPKGWKPPFAADVNNFRFTPRVQRLCELEAHSRLKLDFFGKLNQFFRLQGKEKLKIPNIGGRYLDVYWLYKHVMNAGGYEKVNSDKMWPQIAELLCYPGDKFAVVMKKNYEQFLLHFEHLVSAHPAPKEHERHPANSDSANPNPSKKPPLRSQDDIKFDYTTCKELQNLQFLGPGPRTVISIGKITTPTKDHQDNMGEYLCRVCGLGNNEASLLICSASECQACYHIYCLTPPLEEVPHYQWKCFECVRTLCSRPMDPFGFPQSSRSYTLHEFGLRANAFKAKYFRREPSSVSCVEVEEEFWRILQEYSEDIVVEYGADVHASDQGSGFPTELQLMRSPHFFASAEQRRQALIYAQSPWNLNNLPIYGNSVLRFIKGNVDGMKVPWCYVGMVFSTFCWHTEDHWSCSINFNHWGEPKTWYGVSSADAELFEYAMRKLAGELFELSPDLLHHITTIMNPNLLQAEGVPIYRTDQHCGEFVVTFPRAYHAGFNQGFNFAEAVNVCPPAWLPIGRACVEHYAKMNRQCVFSNDELLFRLAEVVSGRRKMNEYANYTEMASESFRNRNSVSRTCFELGDLRVIHDEFITVVEREIRARRCLLPLCAQAVQFCIDCMMENDDTASGLGNDSDDDDVRICAVCQTTLFFSAIACACRSLNLVANDQCSSQILGQKRKSIPAAPSCADKKPKEAFMVCLEHAESVCEHCPLSECTLYYTHSFEELETICDDLAARITTYEAWRRAFTPFFLPSNTALDAALAVAPPVARVTLETFEKQLKDAQLFGHHTDQLYKHANNYLEVAKDLMRVCDVAADFILDHSSAPLVNSEMENSDIGKSLRSHQSLLEFQLRRHVEAPSSKKAGGRTVTHILQRSIDLTNPREADFLSLLEAVELEEASFPIDLTRGPHFKDDGQSEVKDKVSSSVASLRQLFHLLLPQWRTAVLAAVEENAMWPGRFEQSLPQLRSRLTHPVHQLRDQFPGWCKHSKEVEIIVLMDEVCQWNCASCEKGEDNKGHWRSLSGLRHHLELGEQLFSRLSAIISDVYGNVENGSRRRRANESNVASNESSLPAVTVASRPLLEQLKSLTNATLPTLCQSFAQARSAFLTLVDDLRDLHLSKGATGSGLSAVRQSLANLVILGVHSVVEDTELELASLMDKMKSNRRPTTCLAEFISSHQLRGAASREAEVEMATARLIFEWCSQVTHFFGSGGLSGCSEHSHIRLAYLSDLIVMRRFIFGYTDTKEEGDVNVKLQSPWVQRRCDLDAFCDLNLKVFHNLACLFVDNGNSALPNDLFKSVLEATVGFSLKDDTLLQIQEAAFNRDFETFETYLEASSEAHSAKIRSVLADTTASGLCYACRGYLGLLAISVEPPQACSLCRFRPPRRRVAALTVAELTRSVESDSLNSSDYAIQSLIQAVTSCVRVLERRYCSWLIEIDRLLRRNSKAIGLFLSTQSMGLVDGLPDMLRAAATALRCLKSEAADKASAHRDFIFLLVEGQTLSAIISLPSTCKTLLRDLLLV